ncbi:MAG: hypothetical protein WAK17_26515, partial [Candidatus Nitrosopolaris sp.]
MRLFDHHVNHFSIEAYSYIVIKNYTACFRAIRGANLVEKQNYSCDLPELLWGGCKIISRK